ncbi:MAG: RpoL/Rpb11 RNA polymerase subunit family protein [Nitrososphaerota archaeon]|nr:RpoL/Rpb11 RNA polymerase subunit family protein [Nitrososphaerota archaeon]
MLDEDLGFFDSLSEILQKMNGVQYAGAFMEHPLTKRIFLRIKTDPSQIKALDALERAVKELEELSSHLREAFEKL